MARGEGGGEALAGEWRIEEKLDGFLIADGGNSGEG